MSHKVVNIENGSLPSFEVKVGDTVVWENRDETAHQISSTIPQNGVPEFFFDIGIIFPGEKSSPVIFNSPKNFEGLRYGCGLVPNLEAKVKITGAQSESDGKMTYNTEQSINHENHDIHNDHDHLKHFHGFVTGGKTGDRIYLTHTPIFADERHHFQIILKCSFADPKHTRAYNELRNGVFGNGKVDLFFDHLALIDIESGKLKELEVHSLRYHISREVAINLDTEPGKTIKRTIDIRELHSEFSNGAKVKINKVLHFRKFEPDMSFPQSLTYLMYGNEQEVFMDYYISRAPNFHTVAKLAKIPKFWTREYHDSVLRFQIPSRKILDVSPKTLGRVSFLDNRFHLVWGTPSGLNNGEDPLKRERLNADGNREFDVVLQNGDKGKIEISDLTHFNAAGLLNDGLGY